MFYIEQDNPSYVVKTSFKDYFFPVDMVVSGREASRVEITLNKPHGKKDIIQYVFSELRKGDKIYIPFVNNALKKFAWPDLNFALEILLLDGIIQIKFKNQRPRKGYEWIPQKIMLDPRMQKLLDDKKQEAVVSVSELHALTSELLNSCGNHPLKMHLLNCINERVLRDSDGNAVVESKVYEKYKSILLTLTYYLICKSQNKRIPLRHLSNKIWNKPKILHKYRQDMTRVANISLDNLELVLLPDINKELNFSLVNIEVTQELQELCVQLLGSIEQNEPIERITCHLKHIDDVLGKFDFYLEASNIVQQLLVFFADVKDKIFTESYTEVAILLEKFLTSELKKVSSRLMAMENIRRQFELIVLKEIGSGSFARVYQVYDPTLDKEMACKILFPKTYFRDMYGNDGEEYLLRFKREIRLLSRELKHPNIVSVDKVQHGTARRWFTMPLADSSLKDWIENNPTASEETRMHIYKQILAGVKYLHDCKQCHRDLAPSNILIYISDNGSLQVCIADFGLAKDQKSHSFLTGTSIKGYGRSSYTAPEQLSSLSLADHISDIYSLGAILYNLFSGEPPELRNDKPIIFQSIVSKAMSNKREDRYSTSDELLEDLKNAINRKSLNDFSSFHQLNKYQYTYSFKTDIPCLLDYLLLAKNEPANKIYHYFITPFLSIPRELLRQCCLHEEVVISFIKVLKANLSTLYEKSVGYPVDKLNEINERIVTMFEASKDEKLKLPILNILLMNALIYKQLDAHKLVSKIIEALTKESEIFNIKVANMIEDDFINQFDVLKNLLEGKDYPSQIRYTIGDW